METQVSNVLKSSSQLTGTTQIEVNSDNQLLIGKM